MFRLIALLVSTTLLLVIIGFTAILGAFWHFGRDLPDYQALAHYEPPITTRVYAGDGRLAAEYAVEKRTFVPIDVVPDKVINAFLAAEDKHFYDHPGIDFFGVTRAIVSNLGNKAKGVDKRPEGASTITQQVAKNFLLTNELSYERKVKEAILAFRIEKAFTKRHILELYVNEIYLGMSAYGVAAAAMRYFNKSLDELTYAECAYLAALPKAPNNYHPVRRHKEAVERRNWVLSRMLEDGHITADQYERSVREPLTTRRRDETQMAVGGDYFAEDIRRELAAKYGEEALYKGGLVVRSTLDPKLQQMANRALRKGLLAYDQRHGWRGPVNHFDIGNDWAARLAAIPNPPGMSPWRLSVVIGLGDTGAEIGFADGTRGRIPWNEIKWARPWLEGQRVGTVPKKPADVLKKGDVVMVEGLDREEGGAPAFALRQLPAIDGALVVLDPHTGRVLAMVGGYARERSEFNRASQALRQPGSSFKPFVYLSALESGFTPASLIMDAPVELDQGPGLPKWRPHNYGGDFLGVTTLRIGIEKSRNLMTVRLAQAVGMDKVASYAERFGVVDKLPQVLAMSLGAGETTPLRMATAYGQLANGGKKITPTLIDRIQDRHGKTIYRHDPRNCEVCQQAAYTNQDMPALPDQREQLADPTSVYQIVSIMEGVVQRGTARVVASLNRPVAGKTGTSNDSFDTWFVGFTPDLVAAVFVGFDEPQSLGGHETGGSVAAPIFRDFMGEALAGTPPMPFRIPRGIRLVRINHDTGQPAEPGEKGAFLEAFKADALPVANGPILGSEPVAATVDATGLGVGLPSTEGEAGPAGTPRPVVGGGGFPAGAPTPGAATPVRVAPAPAMGGLY
jgi:penicillin-binding protein 1A